MEKVENAMELLGESFALSKRNTATSLMPIIMILFSVLIFCLGWYVHIVYFQTARSIVGISLILLLLSINFRALLAGINTWIIANTIWEEEIKFGEAIKRTFKAYYAITFYSIVTLIVGLASKRLRDGKKSYIGKLVESVFKGIPGEMWDSIAHLTLPSIMITQKDFHNSLKDIKKAIDYIPEVKYSNIGFDYLMTLLVLANIIVSTILFLAIGSPLISIGFFVLTLMILFTLQSFAKSTYFTVLYIWIGDQVQRKKKKKALEFRLPAILENHVHLNA